MATHFTRCVVCRAKTNCNSEAHVLGCGSCCERGEDGNDINGGLDFCSLTCFLDLSARMWERFRVAEIVAWNGDL